MSAEASPERGRESAESLEALVAAGALQTSKLHTGLAIHWEILKSVILRVILRVILFLYSESVFFCFQATSIMDILRSLQNDCKSKRFFKKPENQKS